MSVTIIIIAVIALSVIFFEQIYSFICKGVLCVGLMFFSSPILSLLAVVSWIAYRIVITKIIYKNAEKISEDMAIKWGLLTCVFGTFGAIAYLFNNRKYAVQWLKQFRLTKKQATILLSVILAIAVIIPIADYNIPQQTVSSGETTSLRIEWRGKTYAMHNPYAIGYEPDKCIRFGIENIYTVKNDPTHQ